MGRPGSIRQEQGVVEELRRKGYGYRWIAGLVDRWIGEKLRSKEVEELRILNFQSSISPQRTENRKLKTSIANR